MTLSLSQTQDRWLKMGLGPLPDAAKVKALRRSGRIPPAPELGMRATPENALKYLYRRMWADPDHRASVLDIRQMDIDDMRVKKIHRRTASAVIKGGLVLRNPGENRAVKQAWDRFQRRLGLHRHEKLHSDARGLMMEGNIPMQWVLDRPQRQVVQGVRMPSETINPRVNPNGTFADPRRAYEQYDLATGRAIAVFALWQLTLGRLDPDNFDDAGSLGRPYLDATRGIWKKLNMTEEDMVLRRRMRAPQRMAHVLKGAKEDELLKYRERVEADQAEGITTDYYMNADGSVTAVAGDANLDQIADVVHLLDAFFSGAPAPKGLFGFVGDLNRDILEDLRRDFFEEVDAMQDTLAGVYQMGLELQLLLDGVSPENFDFEIQFKERRTETPNQAADRALKWQAMGASERTVMETAGMDPDQEDQRRRKERGRANPYPNPTQIGSARVAVTPGNQRKGESATTISTRG